MTVPALEAPPRVKIAAASTKVNPHLVSLVAPASFEAEQYRVLRHLIEERNKEVGLRVVALTSPAVGDGKTTTAINLAGALAQATRGRVLLVDVDLRRGLVREHLGLGHGGGGLSEAIPDSSRSLADVTRHLPAFNLFVVPAGMCPAAPYEALKSARLGDLIAEARQSYDYVVLDTPPLVPVPDCRVIERWVDGLLMVVGAHKTPRKLLEEALAMVDPAKLLGLVFNRDDRPFAGYSGYYGYGHSANGRGPGWWGRVAAAARGDWRRKGRGRVA